MAEARRSRGLIGSVRRLLGGRSETGERPAIPSAAPAPSSPAPDPRVGALTVEWQDLRVSIRRLGVERLARLALSVAVLGAITGPYLVVAGEAAGQLTLSGWVLPALGLGTGLVFLALEAGAIACARRLDRRVRDVEAAIATLLPSVGRLRPLGVATAEGWNSGWTVGAWAVMLWHALLALAWTAVLAANAAGWLGATAR